jgi:hypothetical protein
VALGVVLLGWTHRGRRQNISGVNVKGLEYINIQSNERKLLTIPHIISPP